ncbi:hypothetical protein LE181_16755 [Streptomyces sp. SCA3-4]|uniref:hypothetical protein n=1 Tax=Streptomyces sichuanensis TaxID=2871810 RepID=UPI001CE376CD|nr:hypothetical protein [Streptomyces sichuanensis]MCA6093805.1 hypothetical protein [Streptomyces sichuanensis]
MADTERRRAAPRRGRRDRAGRGETGAGSLMAPGGRPPARRGWTVAGGVAAVGAGMAPDSPPSTMSPL